MVGICPICNKAYRIINETNDIFCNSCFEVLWSEAEKNTKRDENGNIIFNEKDWEYEE